MSCHFKNIFGKPGEGVHSLRLFDVAVFDVVLTVLATWGICNVTRWNPIVVFVGLLVFGALLHRLFCVNTVLS